MSGSYYLIHSLRHEPTPNLHYNHPQNLWKQVEAVGSVVHTPELTPTEYLLAAIITGHRACSQVDAPQWPNLYHAADCHHLVPLLAWAARRDETSIPHEGIKSACQKALADAAAQDVVFSLARRDVTRILSEAAVPTLWIKGAALGPLVYPDPALRAMADLDVLVPSADRTAALATLQAAGYYLVPMAHKLHDTNQAALQDRHHHFMLHPPASDRVIVEVHFHLLGPAGLNLLPDDRMRWLMADPLPIPLDPLHLKAPRHEPHLLYLCAHIAYQHGLDTLNLRWYLDIHWLVTRQPIDWDLILEKAAAWGWTYALDSVLSTTMSLYHTPIPAAVLATLRQHPPAPDDVRRVQAVMGKGAAWYAFWRKMQRYRWPERLRWMWRIAVPPPEYMRRRYQVPPGQPVWRFYLRRWAYQLQGFAASLRRPKPGR